ncbi:MAG: hypothetical protein KBT55_03475 [Porticoccus sp.]|nr:hypothetical protein [Porticoccus sp.]
MSDPIQIPVVNVFGPGSQIEEEGDTLEYLSMPTSMSTFHPPILPEPEDMEEDISVALVLLNKAANALEEIPINERYLEEGNETLFNLEGMSDGELNMINQVLGVGEVSAIIEGPAPIEIQESIMAGLWRIHHLDESKKVIGDYIEVATIPSVIRQLAFQSAHHEVDISTDDLPEGTINSPSILVELDEKVRKHQPEDEPHVINLSLIPLSPEDVFVLGKRLGVGPVTILSKGYGNCRIGSTACQSTWWIKYYNSEDSLILNTIEIVDIPEVASASSEDLTDSAHRLREIIEVYQ